ncbi:MAG: hypothetical protein U0Q19_01515 [Kineosporiaceae bacterium]
MASSHGPVVHLPHLAPMHGPRRHRAATPASTPFSSAIARGDLRGARILRRVTLGMTAVFSLVAVTVLVAEAMADPGGWTGVGLSASWLAPSVVLALLAWRHPDAEAPVLTAATAGLVVLAAWAVVPSGGWAEAEDTYGPVRVACIVAATGVLAFYGWRRPRLAGELLLLVAVTPVVGLVLGAVIAALLGVGDITWRVPVSLAAVTMPAAVLGLMHLATAALTGPRPEQRSAQ